MTRQTLQNTAGQLLLVQTFGLFLLFGISSQTDTNVLFFFQVSAWYIP